MEGSADKLTEIGRILEKLQSSVDDIRLSNQRIVSKLEKVEFKTATLAHLRDIQSPFGAGDLDLGPATVDNGRLEPNQVPSHNSQQSTAQAAPDFQAEFLTLKVASQKVKLPSHFLLNESKT